MYIRTALASHTKYTARCLPKCHGKSAAVFLTSSFTNQAKVLEEVNLGSRNFLTRGWGRQTCVGTLTCTVVGEMTGLTYSNIEVLNISVIRRDSRPYSCARFFSLTPCLETFLWSLVISSSRGFLLYAHRSLSSSISITPNNMHFLAAFRAPSAR